MKLGSMTYEGNGVCRDWIDYKHASLYKIGKKNAKMSTFSQTAVL